MQFCHILKKASRRDEFNCVLDFMSISQQHELFPCQFIASMKLEVGSLWELLGLCSASFDWTYIGPGNPFLFVFISKIIYRKIKTLENNIGFGGKFYIKCHLEIGFEAIHESKLQ